MAAETAEAGIRFTVVDAETLSLIGFTGDETHTEPLSLPLQSDVVLQKSV